MDRTISPRSSITSFQTTSTTESHELRSRSRFSSDAKRSATSMTTFPRFDPSYTQNEPDSNSITERKPSIPYVELERREREEEEKASQHSRNSEREPTRLSDIRHGSHVNAYSECGRHGDDWLFGGKSVSDGVKWIFGKK